MPDVTEQWLTVADINTQVLKCGSLQPGKPLALILPGNPGVADYYEEFMCALYERSAHQLAVWTISHAGHVTTPSYIQPTRPKEDIYCVEGQIRHKLSFIQQFVPQDVPIVLIGHSIGAYMVLKIMEELGTAQILQGVLLFPTIERMATSPKGVIATPLLRYLRWLVPLLAMPVHYLLPMGVKSMITSYIFRNQEVPRCVLKATLHVIAPTCASNILYMAAKEMEGVLEADHSIIKKYWNKLMFYYGATDHWCPLEYYSDMKKQHPKVDIRLCENGYEHAFVLESSIGMANVVMDWLREKEPSLFMD